MRLYKKIVLGCIVALSNLTIAFAQQQVRIEIPLSNIINNTEFSIERNLMNTNANNTWQNMNPTIWSLKNEFKHQTLNASLPSSILRWQLSSIGGQQPKFHQHDVWPGFKYFSESPQTWYEFHNPNASKYTPGNIVFSFKIPGSAFANNTFHTGEYLLTVVHNYNGYFSPNTIEVILVIPSQSNSIEWKLNNSPIFYEMSNLNTYRNLSEKEIMIGDFKIIHFVDFNLWGKSTSEILYTSTKGVTSNLSPTYINLKSTFGKTSKLPLSQNWTNFTPNTPFKVEDGNEKIINLSFSIESMALRNHFFKAGNYKFNLELEAKSIDNLNLSSHITDVTIQVNPLAEITIPSVGQIVNFNFNTNVDYQQGKSQIVPNQIKLSNNETFELYVKSDANFFKKAGIQTDINANILHVGVNGSNIVPLSTTAQQIITSGTPVLDQVLDIQYTIPPTAAQSLVSKEKTTYSINVIYSFTAL